MYHSIVWYSREQCLNYSCSCLFYLWSILYHVFLHLLSNKQMKLIPEYFLDLLGLCVYSIGFLTQDNHKMILVSLSKWCNCDVAINRFRSYSQGPLKRSFRAMNICHPLQPPWTAGWIWNSHLHSSSTKIQHSLMFPGQQRTIERGSNYSGFTPPPTSSIPRDYIR